MRHRVRTWLKGLRYLVHRHSSLQPLIPSLFLQAPLSCMPTLVRIQYVLNLLQKLLHLWSISPKPVESHYNHKIYSNYLICYCNTLFSQLYFVPINSERITPFPCSLKCPHIVFFLEYCWELTLKLNHSSCRVFHINSCKIQTCFIHMLWYCNSNFKNPYFGPVCRLLKKIRRSRNPYSPKQDLRDDMSGIVLACITLCLKVQHKYKF